MAEAEFRRERSNVDDLVDPAVAQGERRIADRLDALGDREQNREARNAGSAGDSGIVDRLDSAEAERVFHRALELEAEALEQPHLFTGEQLEAIADEINMDVAFVRQALGEVRLAPGERSRLDRLILPDHLIEVDTFEGVSRAEIEAMVDRWMTEHEGLIVSGRTDDGATWDIDRRLSSRIRTMRTSGANRISKVAGGDIAHRVYSIGEDEHVVALESVGRGPLLLAKVALAAIAAVLGLGTIGAIVGADSLVEFVRTMSTLVVVGGAAATGTIALARRWGRGIRSALGRSLTGLADRVTRRSKGERRGDGDVVVEVMGDAVKAVLKHIRARRQSRPRH